MTEYNFTNLVLLIGTNPLPNYVTADFFLQKNQNIRKIWLVYSKENGLQGGTFIYADNLERLLAKKWKKERPELEFPLEKIGLSDVSRAGAIQKEIKTSRLKKEIQNGTFHLNYTGATKAMSIHVYRLLHDMPPYEKNISFSYLDARNFRLVGDNDNQIIEKDGVKDLRKIVSISFKDMIGLHGYQLANTNKKKNTEDRNRDIEYSFLIKEFEKYLKINTAEERKDKIKKKQIWKGLEAYVAEKLKTIGEYTEVKKNTDVKSPEWKDGRHKFEIDVAVVKGYQLTGISCTVSDSLTECKKRGFEIILRTRQIGGDESRSILITGVNDDQAEWLQQQLITDTGGNTKNIKVFGIEDLKIEKYLIKELKKFIL